MSGIERVEGDNQESVQIRKELKNGLTKTIEVREIENGYITKKNVFGSLNPENGGDSKYIDKCTEYYTEENPLESKKSKEDDSDEEMEGLLNSIKHL